MSGARGMVASLLLVMALPLSACSGGGGSASDAAVDAPRRDAAPADGAVGDAAPTDGAVGDAAATDGAAGDAAATDGAAGDAAPTDGAVGDAAPTDGAVVDAAPTDGAVSDAAPGDAGGTCDGNGDCAPGEYCAKPLGGCGRSGSCAPRPEICPRIYLPVCGCDGTTYNNECVAASMGVSPRLEGECPTMGCAMRPRPGCCFDADDCGAGQRCEGAMCALGGAGTCVTARLLRGQCWNTDDCAPGEACLGVSRCPCGARCVAPDMPGTCSGP